MARAAGAPEGRLANVSAALLLGGASSRMGRDKSMLPINGRPMIEHICRKLRPHFSQVLISAGDEERYAFLGAPVIPDRVPDRGPLMGIASALGASAHDRNVVVACDMPDVPVLVFNLGPEASYWYLHDGTTLHVDDTDNGGTVATTSSMGVLAI